MKILFAGTPEIAAQSLRAIASNSNHEIVGVLTAPARRSGRSREKIVEPEVKLLADELGLSTFQPTALDQECHAEIERVGGDLLVVVAYGVILPQSFLDLFPRGAINLHPSKLPQYRGASPLVQALLDGLNETGITVQKMALKMDSGPILKQEILSIERADTIESLTVRAALRGSEMLNSVLDNFDSLEPQEQDHERATFCRLVKKSQGIINWEESAEEIFHKYQAYTPWPGLQTKLGKKSIKLLRVLPLPSSDPLLSDGDLCAPNNVPGKVLRADREGIVVATGRGGLQIQELQIAGKRAVSAKEFLNGNPLSEQAVFE